MRYVIILLFLIVPIVGNTQVSGINFGVKSNNLKSIMGDPIQVADRDYLRIFAYMDTLAGLNTVQLFYFAKDTLTRIRYSFTEEHSNENAFISDYDSINDILKNKYGNPSLNDVQWIRDLYRDDTSRYGFAVSIGDLSYFNEWDVEGMNINHALYGDNYEITHVIEYTSKEFIHIEEKAKEAKNIQDF